MNTEKAIDLIDNLIGMVDDNQGNDYDTAFHMAIDALKAQADGDTISRKAAIEEIARWIGYIDEDMILRIQTGLKMLTSAQPKIVRCKDCKHYIKSESYCDYLGITISDHDFCSFAERRTDD